MEVIKDECISKLEVVRILQKAYAEGRVKANDGLVSVLDDINAVDVQPVKGGKWVNGKCTICGKSLEDLFTGEFYYDDNEINFCPNCGSDMRGAENG